MPSSRCSTSSRRPRSFMPEIARLSTAQGDFGERLAKLTAFDASFDEEVERSVAAICGDVRARGDAAVLHYTERFDRVKAARVADLEISPSELGKARSQLKSEERAALEQAAARIRKYHERQRVKSWQFTEADGTTLGQRITPVERTGIYVPGGKAAYPSSVLMNALPAKVAGVAELVMMVPTPSGERNPLVLAAAAIAGVDRVFAVGGAQAIADLATPTSPLPSAAFSAWSASTWSPAPRRSWSSATARPIRIGSRWTSFRRPSTTNRRRRSSLRPTPVSSIESRRASTTSFPECPGAKSSPRRSAGAGRSSGRRTWKKPATSRTALLPSTWSSRSPSRRNG